MGIITSVFAWVLMGFKMFVSRVPGGLVVLSLLGFGSSAIAQVIPDTTLSTRVSSPDRLNFTIDGGVRSGNQLFHSFQEFSVPTRGSALFNNPGDIQNIITRTTGGLPSTIDGLIQANGSANLFLINPQGIVFGANARLDIGGSFLGSTAQRIRFADGTEFSATPTGTPLLTLSAPVGLQFGASAAGISVQGTGNRLRLGADFETIRSDRPTGLQVSSGQTLALIGGDLNLVGGNLTAAEGRIELGSVRSADSVSFGDLSLSSRGFNYSAVSRFGQIRLSRAASADVSGNGAGLIQVQGRRLTLSEGSALIANNIEGDLFEIPARGRAGGGLSIRATESVTLRGTAANALGKPEFVSSLVSEVDLGATGQGGRLAIETGRLRVDDGSLISTTVFGAGRGGNIQISAQAVNLTGGVLGLTLADGSFVDSPSGISADVGISGTGNGGNLSLLTRDLRVVGGANITASTSGSGDAGHLKVRADQVALLGGTEALGTSGLFASVDDVEATGDGGQLMLNADRLQLTGGARISSGTSGVGNAGNIAVTAGEIDLRGASATNPSGILSTARGTATGSGGNLRIRADRLTVVNGAQISALTTGAGNAGNLWINAPAIELMGTGKLGRSGMFASAIIGTGNGGNLTVNADRLLIQNGATVNASNFPSLNFDVPPGQGTVGNITLRSAFLQLRQGSQITTNSQSRQPGGNIAIASRFLVASGNSDITANAVNSLGGNIAVTAQSIVGTRSRPALTGASDITASSELGAAFEGIIRLDLSSIDPSQGIVSLPTQPTNLNQRIENACSAAEDNSFVLSGRGGLPENPMQPLRSQQAWQDLRLGEQRREMLRSQLSPVHLAPPSIIEAQSLQRDTAGKVSLVALLPESFTPTVNCLRANSNPGSPTLPTSEASEFHIPASVR